MLTETTEYVIGVDTHRDMHAYAVVEHATGQLVDEFELPANARGYARACARVRRSGASTLLWAIEGTGSYGAGLCAHLQAHDEQVVEVDHPHRRAHDTPGKSDRRDAIRAARSIISRTHHAQPRTGSGPRASLRVLMIARDGAITTRSDAIRQLKALIISLPDADRARLQGLGRDQLVARCRALRAPRNDPERATIIKALRSIARRAHAATGEAAHHEREIAALIDQICPELVDQSGVGPISAAQLLISLSHPGRLRSEACFARLGGIAPIPASSGKVQRHRLDRTGDRKLNSAIHRIALTRARVDPETQGYLAKRMAEGKSRREAMRCLKRYIARGLFRLMERSM